MSYKAIVLAKDGQEFIHKISSEKMTLGRDKSCDIVLDDVSVSRKHAVIICRFEKVYIENVSPSGQIFKGGSATEYAEIDENVEVTIGPYILLWRNIEQETSPETNAPETENTEDADPLHSPESSAENHQDMNDLESFQPDAGAFNVDSSSSVDHDFSPPALAGFAHVAANEATQVSQQQALPKLRIVKGENEGREIKLDNGSVWVVGRSRKAHIHIENGKLSRQHFKIIKINNRFRIQDMGSSTGTKLNGVTVADAPLQPFDSIQAGPVEMQFLLVDSAYQQVGIDQHAGGALKALGHAAMAQSNDPHENFAQANSTIVNVPVPYDPSQEQAQYANSFNASSVEEEEYLDDENSEHESSDTETESSNKKPVPAWIKKIRREQRKIQKKWQALPPAKQRLYVGTGALALILILGSFVGSDSSDSSAKIATQTPSSPATEFVGSNAAQSPDISPTFYALSIDRQNMIRKLYSDAERALNRSDWQAALDASSQILEHVDKYKETKDIMLQAQARINDDFFKNRSHSFDDAKDAAAKNQERVRMLIDSGTKSLFEQRWKDAEEAFASVLTLDPMNKEAEHGLIAARAKDPNAQWSGDLAEENVIALDPELEEKQRHIEIVDSLERQYQIAADLVRGSGFREAIPILHDLDTKLTRAISDYSGGRAPASIRDELLMTTRAIRSRVEETYDQALSQLDIEYQTQLADADQFAANRQYIQAREIYDSILEREPHYHKVTGARNRLYRRIISEAKTLYQGAVIYESVGDLRAAVTGLQKTRDLLHNVRDYEAIEYLDKAESRLQYLIR
jgi:pSer/pThr/pTyr-binding forkhead associated (FHA) protein